MHNFLKKIFKSKTAVGVTSALLFAFLSLGTGIGLEARSNQSDFENPSETVEATGYTYTKTVGFITPATSVIGSTTLDSTSTVFYVDITYSYTSDDYVMDLLNMGLSKEEIFYTETGTTSTSGDTIYIQDWIVYGGLSAKLKAKTSESRGAPSGNTVTTTTTNAYVQVDGEKYEIIKNGNASANTGVLVSDEQWGDLTTEPIYVGALQSATVAGSTWNLYTPKPLWSMSWPNNATQVYVKSTSELACSELTGITTSYIKKAKGQREKMTVKCPGSYIYLAKVTNGSYQKYTTRGYGQLEIDPNDWNEGDKYVVVAPNRGALSSEYISVDTTAPYSIVAKQGSTTIANNGAVNLSGGNVVLTASDATNSAYVYLANLSKGETTLKKVGYSSYTIKEAGRYQYKAVDAAGNETAVYTISVDDGKAPTVSASVANGGFTNGSVTITASDTYSDAAIVYNRNGGSNQSGGYGNSVTVSDEGVYNYYAHDRALNISATYSFTIDKTKPTISVSVASPSMDRASQAVTLPVGSVATQNFYISVSDPTSNGVSSGIKTFSYKRPNQSAFTDITGKTSITIGYAEGDGVYTFKVVDNAGNETTRTVELKTDTWISDENLRQQPTPTGNTYYITNEKELAWIAWENRMNGSTFAGKIISIDADLDMSAHYWAPLDNISNITFEGNKRVISGIKTLYGVGQGDISATSGDPANCYAGFFGRLSGTCKLNNIILNNVLIEGAWGDACLVGCHSGTLEINNCFVYGKMYGHWGASAGLIGVSSGVCTITKSAFVGTVQGQNSGGDALFIGTIQGSRITIQDCFGYGFLTNTFKPANLSTTYGGMFATITTASANRNITNLVGNININGTQYKSYFGNGAFSSDIWFQEGKLCGGMPLLRQFYWIASAYGRQTISLSGYTKYTA